MKQIIIHSQYNQVYKLNDIALIEIVSPIVFTDLVQPISIPPINLQDGAKVTLYGWGNLTVRIG